MLRSLPPLRRAPLAFRSTLSFTTPSRALFTAVRSSESLTANVYPAASTLIRGQVFARGVASAVSGRPGSQSLGQAALNVREELGNSTSDLAKVIAGANVYADSVIPTQKTFVGITGAVAQTVPTPFMVLGLAGGLPYLGLSSATIYLAYQAGLAVTGGIGSMDPGVAITMLHQALDFQVTYGAVLLSFVGALHWGMEFSGYGGHKGYARLLLGAAPVVFGWSTLALPPMEALIAQWVGYTAVWWADSKATAAGWAPRWFSQYRFYLSILVGTCIISSLAATSYWGPVGGHGLISHDLNMVRAERKQKQPEADGSVRGNVEALLADESGDSYVIIKKKRGEEAG
ncbi:hypothetical protein BKA93DRAFT_751827 [Sparassis latifolia]